MKDGSPALLIRAQPLEHVGIDPDAVTGDAFEEGSGSDVQVAHRIAAPRTRTHGVVPLGPLAPCPAFRTESGTVEDSREARWTADGGEAGVAVTGTADDSGSTAAPQLGQCKEEASAMSELQYRTRRCTGRVSG